MYGYIYKTTNLINGKMYIGKHESKEWDNKYKGSGVLLNKAFEKYGRDNFKCELLDVVDNVPVICDSREQLQKSEKFYIEYYDCVRSSVYYNLAPGGDGGDTISYRSEEDKQKTLEKRKKTNLQRYGEGGFCKGLVLIHKDGERDKRVNPEDLDKYFIDGWTKGSSKHRVTSIETRAKQSQAAKNRESSCKGRITINYKNEKCKKINKEELPKYLSLGWSLGGYKNKFVRTEETRQKLSESHKNQRGSNINKIAIHKESSSTIKYINQEQLQEYISLGWVKGLPARTSQHLESISKSLKGKPSNFRNSFYINNSKEEKRIFDEEELKKYLSEGWTLGGLSKIRINDGKINKFIPRDQLDQYLIEGWQIGVINTKGYKKVICVETNEIFDDTNEVMLKFGFKDAAQVRRYINNQHQFKGYHFQYIEK